MIHILRRAHFSPAVPSDPLSTAPNIAGPTCLLKMRTLCFRSGFYEVNFERSVTLKLQQRRSYSLLPHTQLATTEGQEQPQPLAPLFATRILLLSFETGIRVVGNKQIAWHFLASSPFPPPPEASIPPGQASRGRGTECIRSPEMLQAFKKDGTPPRARQLLKVRAFAGSPSLSPGKREKNDSINVEGKKE